MGNKRYETVKYIVVSILIFIASVIVANIMRIVLTNAKLLSLSYEQANLIATMIESSVGAIAAGFVLYELKMNGNAREHENDIEEAQFLLQYNQSFIQDEKMSETERHLENWMLAYQKDKKIDDCDLITDENKQARVNYLVYLEGLAPLIFKGILKLEHIDNLMAYRFFLAINNPCIQQEQIFAFPDYYRGCIKLYKIWKRYREENGLPIVLEDFSLDLWDKFEIYSSDINIRKCSANDDYADIAGLIYDTDSFIYPAAFGKRSNAQELLPDLMIKKCLFNRNNIRVAIKDGIIYGVALVIYDKSCSQSPDYFKKSNSKNKKSVDNDYFSKITDYIKDNQVYIACLCVDKKQRGKGIGEILLKSIISEFDNSKLILDVLADNKKAIRLYKKCGFTEYEQVDGFSTKKKKPICCKMIRLPEKNS